MESVRLAYITGETHVWNPQGHDKGPASGLSDWPHCAGKLMYGIPRDLVTPQCGVTQVCFSFPSHISSGVISLNRTYRHPLLADGLTALLKQD